MFPFIRNLTVDFGIIFEMRLILFPCKGYCPIFGIEKISRRVWGMECIVNVFV